MMIPVIKAVLIDDELAIRRTLRGLLSPIPEVDVVGEASNVTEGLDLIAECKPDLLFLDIKMPVRSGFDLLDELSEHHQSYGVIFVSGYPDEALTAVQKAASHLHSDFLVKPVDPRQLKEKVRLFYQKWLADKEHEAEMMAQLEEAFAQTGSPELTEPRHLIFHSSSSFHRIPVADIMYCEATNRQINIYCSQVEHINVPNLTLDTLEKLLPEPLFLRIGRSHIINKEAINYLEKGARTRCRLLLNGKVRELQIYASNAEKIEQTSW
ncbi:DNA-binding response regulator [Fibrisoma montanum]|uniref:DNA-binding response regulator n=1 Tax=Fibrisoma montanum TaxID=2305895 RepID=A0A418M032_9BACT|nr:LytTR family DNA-binding domain-containing protein [Fibrisoma montanum]RIV18955.1 DNA-binding response regulator [Fibrisoma montanum]